VSRTRCGVQRRCAEPGPTPHRSLADTGPRLCSAPPKWRCAASGARAVSRAHISLHAVIASAAKQSRISPRRRSGLLRRCAPRNDGRAETASVSQLASPCRHTFAFSRRISPELCFNVPHLFRKRVQGRPGAGWHPWSVRKGMHTGWTTGQPRFGLPCAVVLTASFVLLCPENLPECANGRFSQNRPLLDLSPFVLKGLEPVGERGTDPVVFLNPNSCMGFEPGPSKEGSG